jgi:hypothetical protein
MKIVVLSDGETWESIGEATIWTINDAEYDALCDGIIEPKDCEPTHVEVIEPTE